MNKRGFTLVELLAIVALLALIVIVAAPNIKKEVQLSEKKENDVLNDSIENASKLYVSKYFSDKYTNGEYSNIEFTLSDLESDGLLNLKNNQCEDMKTEKIYIDIDGSYCFKKIHTPNGNCYTLSSTCQQRNEYTITYKGQDENIIQTNNVSCRIGAPCKDNNVPTAPVIENKEFIGWSTSKTDSSVTTTINVSGDETYYAIYTDKYIINFVNNNPYVVEPIGDTSITCIKGKECTFPKIVAASGRNVIGWATSETSTSKSVSSEGKKTFNSAPSTTTYYALAARPITIHLLKNKATKINASNSDCITKSGSNCIKAKASCNIFSDDGECTVYVPLAIKEDYEFVGYASTATAHTELFYSSHTINKEYDGKSYYAIVRQPYDEIKAFTLEVNSASTNTCKTDQSVSNNYDTTKYDYVSFIINSRNNIGSTTAIGGRYFDLDYYVNGYIAHNASFGTSGSSIHFLIEDSKFKNSSALIKLRLNAPCSTSLCSCKSPANAKVDVYFGKFRYE